MSEELFYVLVLIFITGPSSPYGLYNNNFSLPAVRRLAYEREA